MIQRIQTVYLFLGALAIAALGFFSSLWGSSAAAQLSWFVPSLIALIVATAGGGLGAIFLYKQRETQRRVVVGIQVLTVCLAGVIYGGLYLTQELAVEGARGIDWSKTTMLVLPLVGYVLFLLARRGIQHDIELVKSMDRIR